MTDLKWQDPPPSKGGRKAKWPIVGEQLKAHPEQWALVAESVSGGASGSVKRGLGPNFQIATRTRTDGKFDVYARYVGESS